MRKVGIVWIIVCSMLLLGCTTQGEADAVLEAVKGPTKVLLIVTGTLGDRSFNDIAYAGLAQAKVIVGDQIEVNTMELGFDHTRFFSSLETASKGGADIIICGTDDMARYVEEIAGDYPDKRYIVYDAEVNYDKYALDNVYSFSFKKNEGGCLAGVLAAKITLSKQMEGVNGLKKVGFIAGLESTFAIQDFLAGYKQGVALVDPEIDIAVTYLDSFFDSEQATAAAIRQINQGVDVIFALAGGANEGVIDAVNKVGGYVIGVDKDQYTAYDGKPGNQAIVSSAIKKIDYCIAQSIECALDGTLPYGTHKKLGVAEGMVDLAENEVYIGTVPLQIRTQVNEVKNAIIKGQIQVESALENPLAN